MNPSYHDITSRIAEAPGWWQEGGVPRYGTFTPDGTASIYATEAALVEIACQACGTRFNVAFQADKMDIYAGKGIADSIRDGSLHYGDPPNTGCCPSGPTMSSEPVRVVEYWSKDHARYVEKGVVTDYRKYSEWVRDPLLEGKF